MGLLGNIVGNSKKSDVLDLARSFKIEYESDDLENMKSIADKFVITYPDSYFASCAMIIYIISLYKVNPSKVFPNMLNNLSIMESNLKFFDKDNESLDDEELELRQWYKLEVDKNIKHMESLGLRFSQ